MIFVYLYYYKYEFYVNIRCFDWVICYVSLGLCGVVNLELIDGCINIIE